MVSEASAARPSRAPLDPVTILAAIGGDATTIDEIIAAMAGTAQPYFGDLDEMTYARWLHRYAELALGANESAALEQKQKRLANTGELTLDVEQVLALCEGNEDGGGLLEGLRRACATMHHLDGLGERADTARQLLDSAQIQVDEARRELQTLRDGLELDPKRLAEVENRLSAIYTLARKHRVAPAELHRLQESMSDEAAGLDVSDARIGALED